MKKSNIPVLKILDIIQIKRENIRQNTNNKKCYVLSCRINGESLFFYNNSCHTVKKGDILYIPYGSSYVQECRNEEIICFHLETYCSLVGKILIFSNANKEKICELFRTAFEEWKNKKSNYECRCMAILYEILSMCNIVHAEDKNVDHINIIEDYIENHIFDTDLTVEKIYRAANLSRTYFNKIFKSAYGCTPIEYINRQRVKKAKFLLDIGIYTNEEISQLCGFNDVKYFYVVFKKLTGYTTGKYLKLANPVKDKL